MLVQSAALMNNSHIKTEFGAKVRAENLYTGGFNVK